ncbi:MAG: type II toxin-antitoxin system Phd/YefM family antitoxin [Candidatus Limnocylindria bacterium]
MQVNIHEAKTQLSRLVQRAAKGEEIVIAIAGRPIARLVGLRHGTPRRRPGAWRGRVQIQPDFDELPTDLAAAFRGEKG